MAAEARALLDDDLDLAELLMLMSPGEVSITERVAELRPRWWGQAKCRGAGVEVFFNPTLAGIAAGICSTCAAKKECLAAGRGEVAGIWGGHMAPELRPVTRKVPTARRKA
jgi:hypothetical protein